MHFYLPLRLGLWLTVATLALAHSHSSSSSDTLVHPLDAPETPRIPNVLDVLAASPNHTILVRLLQRTRLIPTLMNLMEFGDGRGLTIIAPTDEAIRRKKESEEKARLDAQRTSLSSFPAEYLGADLHAQSAWEWAMQLAEQEDDSNDEDLIVPLWSNDQVKLGNINAVLRQQLLYHMINYTLPFNFTTGGLLQDNVTPSLPAPGSASMLTSLHRPSHRLLHEPTRPGPVPQPPSSPPHPGAEDQGGLLAGKGQKMRIARKDNGQVFLGTDAKGKKGARAVMADRTSRSGLILSIDGVIDLPPSLAILLSTEPTLQHLRNLTTNTLLRSLTETAHTTFFLPTESSFEALSAIEKVFITGDWELAKQDRLKLLGEHMSGIGLGQGKIGYASSLRESGTVDLTTIFGGEIRVQSSSDGKLKVDGASVVAEDILIENGVVHVIDKLLLPFGDLNLSVEKALLALNASRFVSLMHTAGLQHYINASPHNTDSDEDPAEPWTFMVPRDDTIDEWWRDRQQDVDYRLTKWGGMQKSDNTANATKLADMLKYHIAPLQLTPDNLTNNMLIGTELRDWRLKDARQKLSVEVQESVDNSKVTQGNGDVGFGDANVIAEPVKVGPSIVYLISKMLEPPSDPLQTAVSSLSLSTFVAAVFSAQVDKEIKKTPAITYLVPHNEAFAALGLAMQYFLLDQTRSRNELRSLVEYHAIDEIVYMDDFASGSIRYPTLESSPIWAGRSDNGTVEVRRNTEGRSARILEADILTSTGVLHEIDQVELPPTLDLTIGKLMKGAKVDTMTSLVQMAGYGWILNATSPTYEQQAEFEEDLAAMGKFPHKRKHNKDKKKHKKRHELFQDWNQSYVILCPTDNAFTRVNLTYYYSNPDALKALVQLHILPAPANQVMPGGNLNQLPLAIRDTAAFSTLLDSAVGGVSKFGKIAFRKVKTKEEESDFFTGNADGRNLGWIVGVADTRGTDGQKHSANLLAFGRESLSIDRNKATLQTTMRKRPKGGGKGDGEDTWDSRGLGGVLTIDAVLEPYEPGWFYRWGWIALSSFIVGLILASMGFGIWMWWHRDGRISLPEALEGEEE
jgi:solute carrier family 25 carnitine/acylcarnitine transporter 20/29